MAATPTYSEYHASVRCPLQLDHELLCPDDALYVHGIGPIAQYHSYVDLIWSHGVLYFIRDNLQRQIEEGAPGDLHERIGLFNSINSKIRVHERNNANDPLHYDRLPSG